MISHKNFREILRDIAAPETSADPSGWIRENPLWGHCVVVALLAQDTYGGTIVRDSLEHIPQYKHLKSHYWNQLPDGTEIDFTAEQYLDLTTRNLDGEPRSRSAILADSNTARRYELLKSRFTANAVAR